MDLNAAVFDVWVFRRRPTGPEYLVLRSSQIKADRHFNGGRFWQVPSDVVRPGETVVDAIGRKLTLHGLRARSIWAAEHAYTIYNRRFDEIQIVTVYAAEVAGEDPRLDPEEHSEAEWMPYASAIAAVHYRGLKKGLQSVVEYITGPTNPAAELCLRSQEP